MPPKHPEVVVRWSSRFNDDGFKLLADARLGLSSAGVEKAERDRFLLEAMCCDYEHMLQVIAEWVTVEYKTVSC